MYILKKTLSFAKGIHTPSYVCPGITKSLMQVIINKM